MFDTWCGNAHETESRVDDDECCEVEAETNQHSGQHVDQVVCPEQIPLELTELGMFIKKPTFIFFCLLKAYVFIDLQNITEINMAAFVGRLKNATSFCDAFLTII